MLVSICVLYNVIVINAEFMKAENIELLFDTLWDIVSEEIKLQ